jgi:hypothetical protein
MKFTVKTEVTYIKKWVIEAKDAEEIGRFIRSQEMPYPNILSQERVAEAGKAEIHDENGILIDTLKYPKES